MSDELVIYSDGAGDGLAGKPGGWAFVVVRGEKIITQGSGREAKTSSLMMELTAALEGLSAAKPRRGETLVLISDSTITLDVARGTFLPRPKRYHAVCERLRAMFIEKQATARWVKAHAGHRWNEHVDALARSSRLGW